MSVLSRPISRRSPVARRGGHGPRHPARLAPVAPTALSETLSAQRGGGPQDAAHYQCGCGCWFHAAVSTSVGCPACGDTQAW